MSSQFAAIRQELEDLLVAGLTSITDYRLELRSPTDDRGMFLPGTFVHTYNVQGGGAVKRTCSVIMSYSTEVSATERDLVASDRLINQAEFAVDAINYFSRCGPLCEEINSINVDYERGMDINRDPDDYFIWTFISFQMSYQDDPQYPFAPI